MRHALLVLLVACKGGGVDYGDKPHLLGKLDNFDFQHAPGQLDPDGKLTYRVKPTASGGIASATVTVDGAIDDLVAKWGKGTPTKAPGGHIYLDAKARYDVRPAGSGAGFDITATPVRAFASAYDDQADAKWFGVDISNRPMMDVAAELAKHGIDARRMPDAANGAWMLADDPPATELGPIGFSMRATADTLIVQSYTLKFSTHEVDSGQAKVMALLTKKFGEPEPMGPNHVRFKSEHPFVTGTLANDDVEIVVDN